MILGILNHVADNSFQITLDDYMNFGFNDTEAPDFILVVWNPVFHLNVFNDKINL